MNWHHYIKIADQTNYTLSLVPIVGLERQNILCSLLLRVPVLP
jgi:hypothetical protein